MKTKLRDVEQFRDWFMSLSDSVKIKKLNHALANNRLGIILINDDETLRNAIEVMFGNDVLNVVRNSHKVVVDDEPLLYCDSYSENIQGLSWDEIDDFIETELYGWEDFAEQIDVIFE